MRLCMLLMLLVINAVTSAMAAPLDMSGWQVCRQEPSPLVRLACYDKLGSEEDPVGVQTEARSAPWMAIRMQENRRVPESPPFLLQQDARLGFTTLTRPALRGATLAIGCINNITNIRVRLDSAWVGDEVGMSLDDQSVRNGGWFIRDKGWLLEYGRGLPAIEELKRWIGHRELQIQAANGALLRIDLSGLKESLQPVRQQCRW